MASLTQWKWVWVGSGSWWWTGRPGVLPFMGSQRVGHGWVTEPNWLSNFQASNLKKYLRITKWFTWESFCFILINSNSRMKTERQSMNHSVSTSNAVLNHLQWLLWSKMKQPDIVHLLMETRENMYKIVFCQHTELEDRGWRKKYNGTTGIWKAKLRIWKILWCN